MKQLNKSINYNNRPHPKLGPNQKMKKPKDEATQNNVKALMYGVITAIQCRPYCTLGSHQADPPKFFPHLLLGKVELGTYALRVASSDTKVGKQYI